VSSAQALEAPAQGFGPTPRARGDAGGSFQGFWATKVMVAGFDVIATGREAISKKMAGHSGQGTYKGMIFHPPKINGDGGELIS